MTFWWTNILNQGIRWLPCLLCDGLLVTTHFPVSTVQRKTKQNKTKKKKKKKKERKRRNPKQMKEKKLQSVWHF